MMAGKKSGKFDSSGIEGLAKDKPVVYKIENSKGDNIYTGVAKRGRVGERLKEHLPGAKDAIRGGEKVSIQQKSSISDALKAEARIIKSQQPSQNKKGK
jgi:predicted GIY-YIG superfamily endonuclease